MDPEAKEKALKQETDRSYEREEDPLGKRLLMEENLVHYEECNDFYGNPFVVGLLVASLVFLVFTCTMGCEQIEAIETGKGKIARMKMKVGSSGTEYSRVTEEFNEMFGGSSPRVSWHWLVPDHVQFPSGMKKVVLGYEWDPTFDMEPYESDNGSDREMDEMENGKAVNKVPSLVEGDGLVKLPSMDEVSIDDKSASDDNLPPGMKNRKAASRQDTAESDSGTPKAVPIIS